MFKKLLNVTILFYLSVMNPFSKAYITRNNQEANQTEFIGYQVKLSYLDILESYYNETMEYWTVAEVVSEVPTFQEFNDLFYSQDLLSISEFTEVAKKDIDELKSLANKEANELSSSSGGCDKKWYYNTGTSLPQKPSYGKFNFSNIQQGDILYEDAGGPAGTLNHIAVIEGHYYDSIQQSNYYRIVESVECGVTRGVLDDQRFVERKGILFHVPSATLTQRQNAVMWALSQYGKPWGVLPNKPTSSGTPWWQCSTLIWASYKNQGIDIEYKGLFSGIGVTPNDIIRASTTKEYLHY